jgi:hypothetical protein
MEATLSAGLRQSPIVHRTRRHPGTRSANASIGTMPAAVKPSEPDIRIARVAETGTTKRDI